MAFTPINAGPSPSGPKVAIALLEKWLPFQVQLDTPWADETCAPDHIRSATAQKSKRCVGAENTLN